MDEFELIRDLLRRAETPASPLCVVGPGDDAAVFDVAPGQRLVLSIDTLNESVHFPSGIDAADLGWRSLAVNLSDLAAMGARPLWFLLSLSLPDSDRHWLQGFALGLGECARRYGVMLAGGDTTRGPRSIAIQVGGLVGTGGPLLRSGAAPGDLVCVSGTPGSAAAGLALIEAGEPLPAALEQAFLRPVPRIELGELLRGQASAAIDISDGLAQDLSHLLHASGVGACLSLDELPLAADAVRKLGAERAQALCLAGGDDYELCFTIPRGRWPAVREAVAGLGVPVQVIGEIIADPGLHAADADGGRRPLPAVGYQHFGSDLS